MNRSESPSTALRAPSPPLWEKDGMRGYGSWKASFRFCARIGTMNRCASQRRGPDRGSATRSLLGSWKACTISESGIGTMNPIVLVLVLETWRADRERGGGTKGRFMESLDLRF